MAMVLDSRSLTFRTSFRTLETICNSASSIRSCACWIPISLEAMRALRSPQSQTGTYALTFTV